MANRNFVCHSVEVIDLAWAGFSMNTGALNPHTGQAVFSSVISSDT